MTVLVDIGWAAMMIASVVAVFAGLCCAVSKYEDWKRFYPGDKL